MYALYKIQYVNRLSHAQTRGGGWEKNKQERCDTHWCATQNMQRQRALACKAEACTSLQHRVNEGHAKYSVRVCDVSIKARVGMLARSYHTTHSTHTHYTHQDTASTIYEVNHRCDCLTEGHHEA
jgi:hypothetical protein